MTAQEFPQRRFGALVPLLLFLFASVVAVQGADVPWPDSAAASIARGYLEHLNTGDESAYRAWEQANRTKDALGDATMERRLEQWRQFRQMWGSLTVDSIQSAGPRSITLLLQDSNNERWRTFRFELDDDAPPRLEAIHIEQAGDPATMKLSWNSFDDLADLLSQVCEDTGAPAIAAAVVKDGRIIEEAAVGVREMGKTDAVEVDDRFHWGSVTKSATGTIIGSLIEQGVLDWDTTIGEVFAEYEPRAEYRDVTIEHLMGHVAGIDSFTQMRPGMFSKHMAEPTQMARRASFVRSVLQMDPVGTPGKTMQYSNAGITVAGHMAEKLTGKPWETLVEEFVFEPFHMTTAGNGWPRDIGPDEPIGHMRGPSGLRPRDFPRRHPMDPAGNVHSSIGDFARYALAHLDGLAGRDGALKASTIQRLHTPPANVIAPEDYAFGWGMNEFLGEERHWHNGGGGTFLAEIHLFPGQDAGVVFLTNCGFTEALTPRIIEAIYRRYIRGE